MGSMFYREKKTLAGEFLDVDVFPVWLTSKKQRRKKAKPTVEVQEKLNSRNARKKLERLININFNPDDIELHLTYAEEPDGFERAKKDIQNYMRRVKRMRQRATLPEMKYIIVMEQTSMGRYHFHVTISGGIDRDTLEQVWGFGTANSIRLQPDEHGLKKLAGYIFKQEKEEKRKKGWRRWWGSRNLVKPAESTNDYKYSKKAVYELAKSMDHRDVVKLYPGFICLNIKTLYNDVNGGVYISLSLRKINPELTEQKNKSSKKKGRKKDENQKRSGVVQK